MPKISADKKAATRQRLVDAAVEVVRSEGFGAMTTRRILEVAGLSKGALYHYFSSKDDLYEAIAERFVDLDSSLAGELEPLDVHVLAMQENLKPGGSTLLGRLRAAAWDNDAVREVMRRYDTHIVQEYAALNKLSIDSGLFRADVDAEALVEMIAVFVEGLDLREATGFVTDRSRVVSTFVEALIASVAAPEHPDVAELAERLREVATR